LIRPPGLFLALALLLATVATAFGALVVPSEHHGEPGAGHDEHPARVADHEAEEEEKDVLDAGEGLAALAVSVLAIALVPIGIRASRCAEPPEVLRFAVAVASAGAATIHFAVIDQHFAEYWLFAVFFVAVALAQLGWVVAVVSNPTRAVYAVGALGNALIAVTWLISRTTGLPFGPGAGEPETVRIADAVSTAFELAVVVGALVLLRGLEARRSWGVRFIRPVVAIAAIAITTLALAGVAGL
jgi:Na+-transporting methylmalonyl-CoA/oxaloacetate decarboxylase gamma subunit